MNFSPDLDSAIDAWFKEDIGEGDHTTLSTIPEPVRGKARLLVKQAGTLAGVEIASHIFRRFDNELDLIIHLQDGTSVEYGDIVLDVEGNAQSILQCERLVLNVVQRMSGIATSTREYVKLIEGTGAKILDTRKTTPGFRLLEKEAIRIGGGFNHRFGLYDMILIKDNHIDFAGGIQNAIGRAQDYLKQNRLGLKIELEARSLEDILIIMQTGGVDRILLDNFSVEDTHAAVRMIGHKIETESSGGITKENIRKYAECGVDYISVGALTHQVKSLDISLKADFQS
ncbi:MAG: carboxylating nicotinate-nucleotide diphosphorylase [Bacteroidales bacterium]|nr:carboxylating nicotinate-nucleotide diphosphorylase [Bacteroidales bacterium]MBN2699141.1 carboxylating nicotinate-nucleotide diphosphorylase [Bacteroidales bacterium]